MATNNRQQSDHVGLLSGVYRPTRFGFRCPPSSAQSLAARKPHLAFSSLKTTHRITMSGRGKGGKVSSDVSNKCLLQANPRFRVSERAAPSVTARFSVTISRASPSLPSAVSPVEAVSSVSPVSSTKRPEVFSRSSWRTFVPFSLFYSLLLTLLRPGYS